MAAIFIPGNAPSYQILSTDIVANKVTNVSYIGALVLATDTNKYYRVLSDLTLDEIGTETLGASELHIGQVGGTGYIASASFTGNGTATLHAANTHVAPAAGGLLAIPNALRVAGGSAYVTDAAVVCSGSGVVIVPRLHFFSASSVTVAVDSGSWIELIADEPYRQGYFTMPAMTGASASGTNCSRSVTTDASAASQPRMIVAGAANSTNIYVGIETRTAFTCSASQTWYVKLRLDQN